MLLESRVTIMYNVAFSSVIIGMLLKLPMQVRQLLQLNQLSLVFVVNRMQVHYCCITFGSMEEVPSRWHLACGSLQYLDPSLERPLRVEQHSVKL